MRVINLNRATRDQLERYRAGYEECEVRMRAYRANANTPLPFGSILAYEHNEDLADVWIEAGYDAALAALI